MVFKINGVDIRPYIADGGLEYTLNDLDGPNAGRNMRGELIRDRIATKDTWQVTCRPLTGAELATVMQLITPEWVQVQYTQPTTNAVVTKTLYSNNRKVTFRRTNGSMDFYAGLSFPLIEK